MPHHTYQGMRKAIINRDNDVCRWKGCGLTENLQIHHIFGKESTIDEIITLCKRCHRRAGYIKLTLKRGIKSFLQCGRCLHEDSLDEFFIRHETLKSKLTIWTCPRCGRGFIDDEYGDEVDHWETIPFSFWRFSTLKSRK